MGREDEMEENDKLNALAVHLLLDPEVQAKLFRVLAQGLRDGFVRTPLPSGGEIFDRRPVEEFKNAVASVFRVKPEITPNYNGDGFITTLRITDYT